MCSYLQYQLDVETLSESMKRLNSNLDPKSLNNKNNPEILLQLEVRFGLFFVSKFSRFYDVQHYFNLFSNIFCISYPQGDERAIERNEQRLVALREFSSTVAPLKLRRLRPTKPTPVVSLCEWTNGEVENSFIE